MRSRINKYGKLLVDIYSVENIRFGKNMTARFVMTCLHLSIFFLLLYGYGRYIVPIHGTRGFYFEPNEAKFMAALFMTMVLSLSTPIDDKKPSTLYLQVMLVFVMIPMLVLFYAGDKAWSYTIQSMAAYCSILLLLPLFKVKYLHLPSLDNKQLLVFLLVLSVFLIISIFSMGGAAYFNLDISKVYEFRTDAEEKLPWIFGYFSPLLGKVVLPFAMLLSLLLKKYFYALFSFGLSVIVFGLTAHKGPLFYPIAVIFVYFVLSGENVIRNISYAIIAAFCISIVDFMFLEKYDHYLSGWFGSLTMRRMFIVPANINYMYHEYFSVHDFVYWSNSGFTMEFLKYPYALDPPYLIGSEFFNNKYTGANTGWLGSGYMQAGIFGIFGYALIIAVVFGYIDKIATLVEDKRLVIAGTFIPIITLITSSDLPSSFLTHGLLVNLLLIGFLKRRDIRSCAA